MALDCARVNAQIRFRRSRECDPINSFFFFATDSIKGSSLFNCLMKSGTTIRVSTICVSGSPYNFSLDHNPLTVS